MIPLSGSHFAESFTASRHLDEVRVCVHKDQPDGYQGRGELLALALGARPAAGYTFFLTPARFRKWHALFMAGWTARRVTTRFGYKEWIFVLDGRGYARHDAVKIARGKQAPVLDLV